VYGLRVYVYVHICVCVVCLGGLYTCERVYVTHTGTRSVLCILRGGVYVWVCVCVCVDVLG